MALDGSGLRDQLSARPTKDASYPVSVRQVTALIHASSRPRLTATPLRFPSTSPPSSCAEDFHLQAVRHARHTTKPLRGGSKLRFARRFEGPLESRKIFYLATALSAHHPTSARPWRSESDDRLSAPVPDGAGSEAQSPGSADHSGVNREQRPALAAVVSSHGERFCRQVATSAQQRRVLSDITACRTQALGGHVFECDQCGHRKVAYNPCGNRHCPQCQADARAEWLDKRLSDLLPVVYFHVVFTLPHQLAPLALQNPRIVYGILFRTAAETLLEVGTTRLGARFGFLAVLHSWGQTLQAHYHLHCVVPGGGIALHGFRWVRCKGRRFFLPVRVLRHVFRGKVLDLLRQAFLQGELSFHGRLKSLSQERDFRRLLASTKRKPWMVYPKPPFGGPEVALKYLARYTHRVAISDRRLLSLDDGQVRFSYKDYVQGGQQRQMTLDAVEFLRRFLQHVLPKGFVRIRYYGFLAHRNFREQLALARRLLAAPVAEPGSETATTDSTVQQHRCPRCRQANMVLVETLALRRLAALIVFDSS